MATRGKGKEILLAKIIKLEHNYCSNKDEEEEVADQDKGLKIVSSSQHKSKKYQRRS